VIGVAGTARLLRVVSYFGSLLMAVERLDCGVDVEDPRAMPVKGKYPVLVAHPEGERENQ